MEKKGILEKSRRENRYQDERERTVRIRGEAFGLAATMTVGVAILALKFSRGLPVGDTLAMFWAVVLGGAAYKAWKLRRKDEIAVALLALAMLAYYLVRYIRQIW